MQFVLSLGALRSTPAPPQQQHRVPGAPVCRAACSQKPK